jgi:hypothetical protein
VIVCKRLNPNQRTSTLCHELVHIERGIFHTSTTSPESLAEERIVRDISCRRLIPLPNLAAVLAAERDGDHSVWAARLGVAHDDVLDRLANLTADEMAAL